MINLKQYPEFIPVIDWWEKDGKQIALYLVIALAVFGGFKGFQAHRASVKAAAADFAARSRSSRSPIGAS